MEIKRLAAVLSNRPSGLFIDIDGTISPIVDSHQDALVLPECRAALHRLMPHVALMCILTGRPADVAWRMVQVDEALYVGNHGVETWWHGELLRPVGVERYHARIAKAQDMLRLELAGVSGLTFEDKGIGFAVHYRGRPEHADQVYAAARRIAGPRRLAVLRRTDHIEVRVPLVTDKGAAVASLTESHGLKGIVVIGDDDADRPAFQAARAHEARGGGNAVVVTVGESVRADGDIALGDPSAVGSLLADVAAALDGE